MQPQRQEWLPQQVVCFCFVFFCVCVCFVIVLSFFPGPRIDSIVLSVSFDTLNQPEKGTLKTPKWVAPVKTGWFSVPPLVFRATTWWPARIHEAHLAVVSCWHPVAVAQLEPAVPHPNSCLLANLLSQFRACNEAYEKPLQPSWHSAEQKVAEQLVAPASEVAALRPLPVQPLESMPWLQHLCCSYGANPGTPRKVRRGKRFLPTHRTG